MTFHETSGATDRYRCAVLLCVGIVAYLWGWACGLTEASL